jgi:hypothetical protein
MNWNFWVMWCICMCWVPDCVQPPELLCMQMCSILFLWERNSYEFGISFVTIAIVRKMINGFNEDEIGVCWSLMTSSKYLNTIGWYFHNFNCSLFLAILEYLIMTIMLCIWRHLFPISFLWHPHVLMKTSLFFLWGFLMMSRSIGLKLKLVINNHIHP